MSKGRHIILDCYDVPKDICLSDQQLLENGINAAKMGDANIINTMRYRFGHGSPPGCAVIIMLDESHISIHTYSDERKMAIDVFACGGSDARKMVEQLKLDLKLYSYEETEIERFINARA